MPQRRGERGIFAPHEGVERSNEGDEIFDHAGDLSADVHRCFGVHSVDINAFDALPELHMRHASVRRLRFTDENQRIERRPSVSLCTEIRAKNVDQRGLRRSGERLAGLAARNSRPGRFELCMFCAWTLAARDIPAALKSTPTRIFRDIAISARDEYTDGLWA